MQAPAELRASPPPPSGSRGPVAAAKAVVHRVFDGISYALNCEWLALPRWPSAILLVVLLLGLGLAVGLSAGTVVDDVTLGVEFGGGYSLL